MFAVPREALEAIGIDLRPDDWPRVAQHIPHRMRAEWVATVAARDRPVRALGLDVERRERDAPERSVRFEQIDRAEVGKLRHRETRNLLETTLHRGLLASR